MILLPFEVEVDVNYDDERNWTLDSEFFNRHPLITREHFLIDRDGLRRVHYRLLAPDGVFTTREALEETTSHGLYRPNLAETRAFYNAFIDTWKEKPILSLCGALHEQGGHPFIAYVQGEGERFNLFFNWMGFKRAPNGVILVIAN